EQVAAEPPLEFVGLRGQRANQRSQVGVIELERKAKTGARAGMKIKSGQPGRFTAVKLGLHIRQFHVLSKPVNVGGNHGQTKTPALKRAAQYLKIQVGVVCATQGDDAMRVDCRWLGELIGLEGLC